MIINDSELCCLKGNIKKMEVEAQLKYKKMNRRERVMNKVEKTESQKRKTGDMED